MNIDEDLNKTYCGTPINMAPEILNRQLYSFKCDVWSVGTILYEMLTGASPFKDAANKEELKRGHRGAIKYPADVKLSRECKEFIDLCLSLDPSVRPTWAELLQHPFLQGATKHTMSLAGADLRY
jgi:serine/threonine protein kinase